MNKILKSNIDNVRLLCKKYKVKNLYVFGSVLNDKFNSESDIDFLLTFLDDISLEDYTTNYFELHYKFKELFHREIDIITEKMLSNPFFIDSINKNKILVYEYGN